MGTSSTLFYASSAALMYAEDDPLYVYMQNRDDTVIEVVKKVRDEKKSWGRKRLEELRALR
jgi:hypothetical protein